MTTLAIAPSIHDNRSGIYGPDGSRRIVATFGNRAYVDDNITGKREEWQLGSGACSRIIDGKQYVKVGVVSPVRIQKEVAL